MIKHVKSTLVIPFLLQVFPAGVFSQDIEEYKINSQLWADYYSYYFIDRKWQVYGNAGYNALLDDGAMDELYIDPAIRWQGRKWFELHGGLSVHYTFYKDTVDLFEFRSHQSVKFNWPNFKRIWFVNTLRLEERCVFPVDTWKVQFKLKFRYDFAFTVRIYSWNMNYLQMPVDVEYFFNLGQKLTEVFSNQSRWNLGLGYRWNKWAAEAKLAWQRSRTGVDKDFRTNDFIIQLKLRQFLFLEKYSRAIRSDHIN